MAAHLKRGAAALSQVGRHRVCSVARQGQAAGPERRAWRRPPTHTERVHEPNLGCVSLLRAIDC